MHCRQATRWFGPVVRAAALLAVIVPLPATAGVPAEVAEDWADQDGLRAGASPTAEIVGKVLAEMGRAGADLRVELDGLRQAGAAPADERWRALYLKACARRREVRLGPYLPRIRRVAFTKHYDMGGSHYAYTEGQSDAQRERHFQPGASLCVLEMDGAYGKVRTLIEDAQGVFRDPDVSYDGERVLFAWKKSDREDDYHLYELTVADGKVRQLTSGIGFADYEGAYLPNGDIVFNSTRCVQTVDCWWTEVSNLFTCDGDGRFLRRLSYDQVHTNCPTVTPDGRVLYTRWDYNDRGQIYPQGLFQMYPDGTGQTEVYGNNSYFPTTILHARAIPGTGRIVAIFTGHHTRQNGQLGIIDPARGRQENQGAQLIAPVRPTEAVRVDRYGQGGDQFQYPYPLSETAFLVAMRPAGIRGRHFGIYLVTADGRRELLASDPRISCSQPVPLAPRPVPHRRPSLVDYRAKAGTVYLQDIHEGPGLAGVPRGSIRRLRVVALEFRAAGVGSNSNGGPAGGALVSTPISVNGAWDVKVVLGEAAVRADGSACFTVPSKTPVYFQALDERGHAVQTMRSWLTVQPAERVGCVGCHENKNTSPPIGPVTLALRAGPKELKGFHGLPRGFSFQREVQPILDRHCVRCHHQDAPPKYIRARAPRARPTVDWRSFAFVVPFAGATWRYTTDRPGRLWMSPDFDDANWAYGPGGFGRKGTPGARIGTAWTSPDIWLRRTFSVEEAAMPKAPSLLVHHDEDVEVYLNGVPAARRASYTTDYTLVAMSPAAAKALKPAPAENVLAVHCRQTIGGQFIDVGIVDTARRATAAPAPKPIEPAPQPEEAPPAPGQVRPAFSLKGAPGTWSRSYMALAHPAVNSWISPQSVPSMLPPYHAGAAKSRLVAMLRAGHNGVKLSAEEMDRITCWIDLLVPCFGDYLEGIRDDKGRRAYEHFLAKRRRWEAQERKNIQAYVERAGAGP